MRAIALPDQETQERVLDDIGRRLAIVQAAKGMLMQLGRVTPKQRIEINLAG